MRPRSVVSALLVLTAGAAASVVARHLVARRRPAAAPVAVAPVAPAPVAETLVAPAPERQAVVLPFTRPVVPAPAPQAAPARCGDSGGRTKAGAPCAGRATSGGRCHHHRVAA
jgi:hypothetical protein